MTNNQKLNVVLIIFILFCLILKLYNSGLSTVELFNVPGMVEVQDNNQLELPSSPSIPDAPILPRVPISNEDLESAKDFIRNQAISLYGLGPHEDIIDNYNGELDDLDFNPDEEGAIDYSEGRRLSQNNSPGREAVMDNSKPSLNNPDDFSNEASDESSAPRRVVKELDSLGYVINEPNKERDLYCLREGTCQNLDSQIQNENQNDFSFIPTEDWVNMNTSREVYGDDYDQ